MLANERLKILNYHNVEQPPTGAAYPKLYVEPAQFARQMWCLKQLGLRGVSLSEGLALLARGRAARAVVVTFDDGYADNLHQAAPILREFGFSATCYVVSRRVGTFNQWDADRLNVRKPLMSEGELRRWLNEGFEIGSHTRTHPALDTLDAAASEDEIAGSRADLESLTGVRIEHFCYPYGAFNETSVRHVAAAGYRSAVTTQRGIVRANDDPFRLSRIAVGPSFFRFTLKAAMPYASWSRWQAAA